MATVPTPYDFTAGSATPGAAALDAGIKDVLDFLLSPPRCHVYRSTNLSVPNATWTVVGWDSERWDTQGIHSSSSGRLIAQTAGTYEVGVNAFFAPSATGSRGINITKNGAGVATGTSTLSSGFSSGVNSSNQLLSAVTLETFAVGDYVELFVYQSSGAALNLIGASQYASHFWIRWVSS